METFGSPMCNHGEVVVRLDIGSQVLLGRGSHVVGWCNTMHGIVKGPFSEQIQGGGGGEGDMRGNDHEGRRACNWKSC